MAMVSEGVRGLLTTAGVGTVTQGQDWAINVSELPDQPDRCIVIVDTGMVSRDPKWLLDFATFQVRVRGRPGDYPDVYAKAIAIADALIGLTSQTIAGDIWMSLTALGGIIYMGQDEKNRPEISSNFRLIMEPAPSVGSYRLPLGP